MPERPRMLLVDDDTTPCRVPARAFENRGCAVSVAHAGTPAVQRVVDDAPDIAVIDLRLPDMSGLRVVQSLMTANPKARAVVFTGFGGIATAIDAIRLGALSYLTKPVNADQIVAALQPNAPKSTAPCPGGRCRSNAWRGNTSGVCSPGRTTTSRPRRAA